MKTWVIVLLVVLGLAVLGAIYYFFFWGQLEVASKGIMQPREGSAFKQVGFRYKGKELLIDDTLPLKSLATSNNFSAHFNENGAVVIQLGNKTKTIPYEQIVTGPLEI